MTDFKDKADEIQSKGKFFVEREPGFVAVSLSKVVEIYSDNLCIVCLDSNEFELEFLDTVFSPTPRDEYLREVVTDMVYDTSDGINKLFDVIKDVMGEHSTSVKKEDYSTWSESYSKELQTMLAPSIADLDLETTIVEVLVMKNLESLVFIIFADGESNAISLLEFDKEDTIVEIQEDEIILDDEDMEDPFGMPGEDEDSDEEESPI